MTNDARADLARFIDRWTIEYVRVYPHPIERVWRAITDAKEISVWFWQAKFDLRVGGAFKFGPDESGLYGVFDAIDPPRLVRFKGPSPAENHEGYFQFALAQLLGGKAVDDVSLEQSGLMPVYREHMLATQP